MIRRLELIKNNWNGLFLAETCSNLSNVSSYARLSTVDVNIMRNGMSDIKISFKCLDMYVEQFGARLKHQ